MSKKRVFNDEQFTVTFGAPEPIPYGNISDYLGVFLEQTGEYYIPPILLSGLAQMRKANVHHGSCVIFRRNAASIAYKGGGLSYGDCKKAITDYISLGNAYIERRRNAFGYVAALNHIPAINMRVLGDGKGFRRLLDSHGRYVDFAPDDIFHIKEYDEVQQIYGIPDWLGGMQAALLNTDATLFRRRYFLNGAHVGYILYTSDPKLNPKTREDLVQKLKDSKGAGNFKSSYIHIPGGAEKAIQVIPIGDISQRDEFMNVKNISANDVLTAHRVPPPLMGILPSVAGGFGDPTKYKEVYKEMEVASICRNFTDINPALPRSLQLDFDFVEHKGAE